MDDKERQWRLKRCGRFTASRIKDLMTPGRAKGVKYGTSAVDYLYEIARERRTGKPIYKQDNYNFEYGRENEPYAIEWLRNNSALNVQNCNTDFADKVFVLHPEMPFSGDSPDGYVNETDLLEVKSLASEAKFERLRESPREDLALEYRDQFCQHFACHPNAKKLYYLIYDGTHDDDEFDERDPNALDRGKLVIFNRFEFEDRITEIEARQREANNFLVVHEDMGIPIYCINDYLKEKGELSNG